MRMQNTDVSSSPSYFVDTAVAYSPLDTLKSNSSLHMYKFLKRFIRRQEKKIDIIMKLKFSADCAFRLYSAPKVFWDS